MVNCSLFFRQNVIPKDWQWLTRILSLPKKCTDRKIDELEIDLINLLPKRKYHLGATRIHPFFKLPEKNSPGKGSPGSRTADLQGAEKFSINWKPLKPAIQLPNNLWYTMDVFQASMFFQEPFVAVSGRGIDLGSSSVVLGCRWEVADEISWKLVVVFFLWGGLTPSQHRCVLGLWMHKG